MGEKEGIGFGILKRISNIQHECSMFKFGDEGGTGGEGVIVAIAIGIGIGIEIGIVNF